jgi:RimJ/RimL family protein N-acetyltransferase
VKPDASVGERDGPRQIDLRGGRRVTVRPIVPEDRQELLDAFERLSFASRYSRFMGPVKALSERMLDRALNPVSEREHALVALAEVGGEEDIVGGARYALEPGGAACEFAIMIADDWHGVGLGSALMRELIRVARARGLQRMYGLVLSDNSAMLGLARRMGFRAGPSSEGPGVRLVTLDLDAAAPV